MNVRSKKNKTKFFPITKSLIASQEKFHNQNCEFTGTYHIRISDLKVV